MILKGRRRERGAALAITLFIVVLMIVLSAYVVHLVYRRNQARKYGITNEIAYELSKGVVSAAVTSLSIVDNWNTTEEGNIITNLNSPDWNNIQNSLNTLLNNLNGNWQLNGNVNCQQLNSHHQGYCTFILTNDQFNNKTIAAEVKLRVYYVDYRGGRADSNPSPGNPNNVRNYQLFKVEPSGTLSPNSIYIHLDVSIGPADGNGNLVNTFLTKGFIWKFTILTPLLGSSKDSFQLITSAYATPDLYGLDLLYLAANGIDPTYGIGLASEGNFAKFNNAIAYITTLQKYYGALTKGVSGLPIPDDLDNFLKNNGDARGVLSFWTGGSSPKNVGTNVYSSRFKDLDVNGGGVTQSNMPDSKLGNLAGTVWQTSQDISWEVGMYNPLGVEEGSTYKVIKELEREVSSSSQPDVNPIVIDLSPTGIGLVQIPASGQNANGNSVVRRANLVFNGENNIYLSKQQTDNYGKLLEFAWLDKDNDDNFDIPYMAKLMMNAYGSNLPITPEDLENDEWLTSSYRPPRAADVYVRFETREQGGNYITEVHIQPVGGYSNKPIQLDNIDNRIRIDNDLGDAVDSDYNNNEIVITINSNDPRVRASKIPILIRGGNVILTSDDTPTVPVTLIAAPSRDNGDIKTISAVRNDNPKETVYHTGTLSYTMSGDSITAPNPDSYSDYVFIGQLKLGPAGSEQDLLTINPTGEGNPINLRATGAMFYMFDQTQINSVKNNCFGGTSCTVNNLDMSQWRFVLPQLPENYNDPGYEGVRSSAATRYRYLMTIEGNVFYTNAKKDFFEELISNHDPNDISDDDVTNGLGISTTEDYDNTHGNSAFNGDLSNLKQYLKDFIDVNNNGEYDAGTDYLAAPVGIVATNFVFLYPIDPDLHASNYNSQSFDIIGLKGYMASINDSVYLIDKDVVKYFLARTGKSISSVSGYWQNTVEEYAPYSKADGTGERNIFYVQGGIISQFGDIEGALVYDGNQDKILGMESQFYDSLPDSWLSRLFIPAYSTSPVVYKISSGGSTITVMKLILDKIVEL